VTTAQLKLIALGGYRVRYEALDTTTGQVKLKGLRDDDDARYFAYLVALGLWRGDYEDAGVVIDQFRKSGPHAMNFLKLVADALKNGSQFEPTTCRRRLIIAHDAAWLVAVKKCVVRGRVSIRDLKPPTLQQWKNQHERRFSQAGLPADSTFYRAAKELSLLYSPQIGRPPGSRDQEHRKRSLKSRAKKGVQR
jgi:hypothetical protein